jgi:Domain of unknown function (DUF4166)
MQTAESGQASAPALYARLLGDRWARLADPVRRAHATGGGLSARGCFRVERGPHPIARAIASLLRLPPTDPAAEIALTVTPENGAEEWARQIGGHELITRQSAAGADLLAERIRLLEFRFHLDLAAGSLVYRQRGVALMLGPLRIPLPERWAPRIEAREDPVDRCRTRVSVRVSLPILGQLIAYDGTVDFEELSS